MGKGKKRVSLKDMPMTRAQVIMRDEMLRHPKLIDSIGTGDDYMSGVASVGQPDEVLAELPPVAWRSGKCRECGEELFALEVQPNRYSWYHNRFGHRTPQDNHISTFATAILEQDDRVGPGRDFTPLSDVLDEIIGVAVKTAEARDTVVREMAWNIINDAPPLQLSLQQWDAVQKMVEAGIRAGSDAEQAGRL